MLCLPTLGDFYPDSDEGEPEPEWVKTERESFHRDHDKNGDGKMDASEIMSWIIPDDYDHTVAETQHLLQESDSDKVCSLSLTNTHTPSLNHPHPQIAVTETLDCWSVRQTRS